MPFRTHALVAHEKDEVVKSRLLSCNSGTKLDSQRSNELLGVAIRTFCLAIKEIILLMLRLSLNSDIIFSARRL
jgi:hypothetical protein